MTSLRAWQLGQDALDWLKTNFYKTELELGHCDLGEPCVLPDYLH